MSYDELVKLGELRDSGVLTDAEFAAEKARLLGSRAPSAPMVPPTAPKVAPSKAKTAPSKVKKKLPKKTRNFLILWAVTAIIIIAVVTSSSSGPHAKITGQATSVVALDSNMVRVYIQWTNTGKASGSADCAMDTNVYDQFGDQVNIEVNETGTNSNVVPGATQTVYQDIGVNNGDAQYIKPSDVSFSGC
jgi:hypothetical protein